VTSPRPSLAGSPGMLRRALQLALLVVPLAYLIGGRWWAVGIAGAGLLLSGGFDYLRLRRFPGWSSWTARRLSPLLRKKGAAEPLRTTFQLGAALLVLLAVPAGAAVPALLWQAAGDAAAGEAGRRWGRHRILGTKTVEGTVAGLLACLVVAAPLLALRRLGFGPAEWLVGAAAASVVELLCQEAEDDFLVPVGAAAAVTASLWIRAAAG